MPEIDINLILAFVFGLMMLYLLAPLMAYPFRWLLKAAGKTAVGGAVLIVFNLLGGIAGLSLGVNLFTAAAVGFLGLPGIITLLVMKNVLGR